MDWFYSLDGQQEGPVSQEALQGLLQIGTVSTGTLVWREGMTDWQSYQDAVGQLEPAVAAPTPGPAYRETQTA